MENDSNEPTVMKIQVFARISAKPGMKEGIPGIPDLPPLPKDGVTYDLRGLLEQGIEIRELSIPVPMSIQTKPLVLFKALRSKKQFRVETQNSVTEQIMRALTERVFEAISKHTNLRTSTLIFLTKQHEFASQLLVEYNRGYAEGALKGVYDERKWWQKNWWKFWLHGKRV